tara:strand:- start:45 stop:773 length:729 start_codon:yes stop_codon:yes gene_type:complete
MKKRTVFILGASSDIGVSILKRYLDNDYEIVAHYNKGSKNFFDLVDQNPDIKKIKFNFSTNLKNINNFLKNSVIKNCDVFINAAAVLKDIKYEKFSIQDLHETLKVNLFPGVMLTKLLGEKMFKNKWGRIVHLSSIGSKFGGGQSTFCYSLSKFGLEFFPNKIKIWAGKDVLVNTVRVGLTDTKLHKNIKARKTNFGMKKRIKRVPLNRMATTDEISKLVYNLGSEENTYITGEVITIAGGE